MKMVWERTYYHNGIGMLNHINPNREVEPVLKTYFLRNIEINSNEMIERKRMDFLYELNN